MSQKEIDWQELDREYFELWDWVLRECDGDWMKDYSGRNTKKVETYKEKLGRFAEIREQIDSRSQDFYFCWMETQWVTWCRGFTYNNSQAFTDFEDLAWTDKSFRKIASVFNKINGAYDRYYFLTALYSALKSSSDGGATIEKLKEARKNYRISHHCYSEVFDFLLEHKGSLSEAVNILYKYLLYARTHISESIEIACSFSAIKVKQISEERAWEIKRASEEEFKNILEPEMGNYSFFFCEADIIYPHRRHRIVPFFRKFENVASIDFFYKCVADEFADEFYSSDFSSWPLETTHTIDRWSDNHVSCFRDFFIGYAEQENTKWRDRFEANIVSEDPKTAEKYLMRVFQLDKSGNRPSAPVHPNPDSDDSKNREQQNPVTEKNEIKKNCGRKITPRSLWVIEQERKERLVPCKN